MGDEEILTLLDPADVPELEGDWMVFADAAELLGISRQALHKQVFLTPDADPAKTRYLRTVRRVPRSGPPLYVLKRAEVEAEQRRKQGYRPADR